MTSWNRRVAAATRIRESDGECTGERLAGFGLPTNLHPDDATAVFSLLRIAEGRPGGFGTTILARVEGDYGNPDRTVRIVVLGNERGATTLVGDADDKVILDNLTGLPGREYLLEMLEDAIQDTVTSDHSIAVYSIDIDRFKSVNNTRGFSAGDDALRFLAAKLEDALRPDDVLTRFGGDEFTIVCPHVRGVAEATALGERFRATCIDIGRDRCELFDDELRTRAARRNTVDQRLRTALDNDTIEVHYQPIVELETERVVGCEALLRIAGEDGSHLNARELVDAAEDSGLIRRIEETVLQRAAAAVRTLPQMGDNPIFVSLNVSDQRVLDSRFPLTLARTMHNADLPAEQVQLELHPEILSQKGAGLRLITQLRALGAGIIIDEYLGASDSTLINKNSIDLVKLDKRLVHGIHTDRGRTRAELVIGSITDRGIDVCAVGVETPEDLVAIRELGCRYAQGYLLSSPIEVIRLAELVAAQG
ncbi:MAG: GGDEF and EAL domain-containing protein [Acidimicrobiales bacterium]|nr:GGDEF and EAL domain-containing protein [Acidimicrobiales bacterium]